VWVSVYGALQGGPYKLHAVIVLSV